MKHPAYSFISRRRRPQAIAMTLSRKSTTKEIARLFKTIINTIMGN
jgi:hypothetical protein